MDTLKRPAPRQLGFWYNCQSQISSYSVIFIVNEINTIKDQIWGRIIIGARLWYGYKKEPPGPNGKPLIQNLPYHANYVAIKSSIPSIGRHNGGYPNNCT
jgi:hypothetical protein